MEDWLDDDLTIPETAHHWSGDGEPPKRTIDDYLKTIVPSAVDEACGNCCTCRWFRPDDDLSRVGVCYQSPHTFEKHMCDFCSLYTFFED